MKYTVEIDGINYQVELEDIHTRPVIAIIDGNRVEVWPEEDQIEQAPAQPSPKITIPEDTPTLPKATPLAAGSGGKELSAPLPGVIVAILVKPGDNVVRGQELLTLEAMKMKNAIKSQRDGTIASVNVNVGDQVAHGQSLVTFKG